MMWTTCQGYSWASDACPPTMRPLAAPPLLPHWRQTGGFVREENCQARTRHKEIKHLARSFRGSSSRRNSRSRSSLSWPRSHYGNLRRTRLQLLWLFFWDFLVCDFFCGDFCFFLMWHCHLTPEAACGVLLVWAELERQGSFLLRGRNRLSPTLSKGAGKFRKFFPFHFPLW